MQQAANIRTAMDGQLYFFGKVLGFNASMPPGLPDIIIDNLPAAVQTVHTVQAGTSKAGAESAQAVGGAESARHADVGVPALQADPQPA